MPDGMRQGRALDHFLSVLMSEGEYRIHREANDDSLGIVHETEENTKAAKTVTHNDSSQSSSSKDVGSAVSAILAVAGVAAAVYEAVSESRNERRSKHGEDKVINDRNSFPVGKGTPTIKDSQVLAVEKDVAVNCTALQAVVVVDPISPMTTTAPTPTAVALDKAQTNVQRSGYVKREIARSAC